MAESPVWQHLQVCMWVDKSNFEPVRQMLREEYGLVNARDDMIKWSLIPGRKLVYVDQETGQGVWRADFREKDKNSPYWPNDLISFGYWDFFSRIPTVSARIREEDPMKAALIDAYQMLHPERVTLGFEIGEPVDIGKLLGV